ncbi:DUF4376 domain-containing protein [bacterium]|nr:DUF4376 domain-containing protein [bacterium]
MVRAGGTNWKQVACGGSHTACIKTDGTLWMWGRNDNGRLGTNDTTHRSSPVQTVAGGTNWKQVAGGGNYTGCIKTDGTLWMWGSNGSGQLGDNTTNDKSSPVQTVVGGTNWKQVACGSHTGCIKTDGTLWMWGYNFYGQLGDNTGTNRSSPVQTVAGGTNWKQVACGGNHTACIKTDGTLWMWGYNFFGQLGDNTGTTRTSPVQTIIHSLPTTMPEGQPYTVDENTKIYSVAPGVDHDIDPKIHARNGPFWKFTENHALYHYEPLLLELEAAKNLLLPEIAAERWRRENSGVKVTIQGIEYSFASDRDTRNVLQNALNSNQLTFNWKVNSTVWLELSQQDIALVLQFILSHIQSCFDWEKTTIDTLMSFTTHDQISEFIFKEPITDLVLSPH